MALAEAGYTVAGIDRSEIMVQRAREVAVKRGVDLRLNVDDMRSFTSDQRFDVVTSLFDAINSITEEADLAKVFHDSETVNLALRQFLAEHGEPPRSSKPSAG